MAATPAQPWLTRPDWAAGYCANHSSARARFFLAIGIIMIGIPAPAISHPVAWPFLIIGATLVITSIKTIRAQSLYSTSILTLPTIPLRRGANITAQWQLTKPIPNPNLEAELRIKVRGLASRHERSGEQIIHTQRTAVPRTLQIPLILPLDAPPTTGHDVRSSGTVTWDLTLYNHGQEVAWFTLPIFDTPSVTSAPSILRFPSGPRAKILWPAALCALTGLTAYALGYTFAAITLAIFALALAAPLLETATQLELSPPWLTMRAHTALFSKIKQQIGLSEIQSAAAVPSSHGLYDLQLRTIYGRTWTLVRDQPALQAKQAADLINRNRNSRPSA
ncbi:MAG: hypothetical protein JST93_35950 [Acidobacteria bacterium]|nr:hypothetical protein [Acidobacteriota bacterium]